MTHHFSDQAGSYFHPSQGVRPARTTAALNTSFLSPASQDFTVLPANMGSFPIQSPSVHGMLTMPSPHHLQVPLSPQPSPHQYLPQAHFAHVPQPSQSRAQMSKLSTNVPIAIPSAPYTSTKTVYGTADFPPSVLSPGSSIIGDPFSALSLSTAPSSAPWLSPAPISSGPRLYGLGVAPSFPPATEHHLPSAEHQFPSFQSFTTPSMASAGHPYGLTTSAPVEGTSPTAQSSQPAVIPMGLWLPTYLTMAESLPIPTTSDPAIARHTLGVQPGTSVDSTSSTSSVPQSPAHPLSLIQDQDMLLRFQKGHIQSQAFPVAIPQTHLAGPLDPLSGLENARNPVRLPSTRKPEQIVPFLAGPQIAPVVQVSQHGSRTGPAPRLTAQQLQSLRTHSNYEGQWAHNHAHTQRRVTRPGPYSGSPSTGVSLSPLAARRSEGRRGSATSTSSTSPNGVFPMDGLPSLPSATSPIRMLVPNSVISASPMMSQGTLTRELDDPSTFLQAAGSVGSDSLLGLSFQPPVPVYSPSSQYHLPAFSPPKPQAANLHPPHDCLPDDAHASSHTSSSAIKEGKISIDHSLIDASFRQPEYEVHRTVLDKILTTHWFKTHQPEPKISGPYDMLCSGLGVTGRSVYTCFLKHVGGRSGVQAGVTPNGGGGKWLCLFGDETHPCPKASWEEGFSKPERAVEHVRSHLGHRPFWCENRCNSNPPCAWKFFASSHRYDHWKKPHKKVICHVCNEQVAHQAFARHLESHSE